MTSLLSNQISLIYNPHAGFGHWDGTVRRIANFWQHKGWEVMICPTARPGHATQLAARAAEMKHGLVLAAGGDGTLSEVANGLAHTETILAPLPVGTGNSFAKELRMPRPTLVDWGQLQQASEALLQGTVQQMDLGVTGDGRYWLLWIGTGLDGFVVDQIEPRSKIFKQLGPAGYAAKALYFLPNFPTMRAEVTVVQGNGITYQTQDDFMMISICNCRLFAGGEVRLNATAVMDDGQFEVWLFRGQQWPTMMRYVLEIGLENHADDPSIDMIRGKAVSVESTPAMPYHVDGEPTADTPFHCEIDPNALRLLVPQTAPRGLFKKVGSPLAQVFATVLIAVAWLWLQTGSAHAAPPVDPLTVVCDEGNFLHIQSGACLPLHTTYGFKGFPEPKERVELQSCELRELRSAVSEGDRIIILLPGCTYDLGSKDLAVKSNTIIDGGSSPSGGLQQPKQAVATANAVNTAIASTLTSTLTLSRTHMMTVATAETSIIATPATQATPQTGKEQSDAVLKAAAPVQQEGMAESADVNTTITCTGTTAFRIHDVSNVIIRNVTIDGMNNQRSNQGCGTLVFIDQGAENVLVERVRMRNGLGKGVGFRTASRVTVRYSWVQDMWDDHGLNADKNFVDIAYYSNYITNVGTSQGKIGYGINSHASKAEIAGNFIENTDSGIKLMGARFTLLHHNTIVGASHRNPLYRGVWTAIDNKDNVRPETLVYYANFIDTNGVRPFSVLDGATDIYLAGNYYGNVSNHIPVSNGSSVYQCINSTDRRLTGTLIEIESRKVSFPDSGLTEFDPCTFQAITASQGTILPPVISQNIESQTLLEGQKATLSVAVAGAGTVAYQWQRRIGSGEWFDIYRATDSTHTTRSLRLYNSGNQYRVRIKSEFGRALSKVATLTVAPAESCVVASKSWQSRSLLPHRDRFSATFLATPLTDINDGLIGLSAGPAASFTDLGVIIRFSRSGRIDVRNARNYSADENIPYAMGQAFRFRVEVDVAKHIYSVYVAPYENGEINGVEVELADDYAFRSEQAAVAELDSWSFWDGEGQMEICELTP